MEYTFEPIPPVLVAPGADPHGEHAFDVEPYRRDVPSAWQRRAERQLRRFALGFHPVGLAHKVTLKVHPQAAPADDREAPGLRCGTCVFRTILDYRKKQYPKCMGPGHAYEGHRDPQDRLTVRGKGIDVPAWWPACTDYQQAPEEKEQDQ